MALKQEPARFSRDEAHEKLGRRVRSVVWLNDIPSGTSGNVTRIDEIENGFELIIEWDLRGASGFQFDWFTKDQYERCLIEETKALDG